MVRADELAERQRVLLGVAQQLHNLHGEHRRLLQLRVGLPALLDVHAHVVRLVALLADQNEVVAAQSVQQVFDVANSVVGGIEDAVVGGEVRLGKLR